MLLEPAAPAPARRAGEASGELDLDASTEAPYLDALRAYAAGDPVRLTVPGHKGGAAAPAALARALEDALALDVPALIEGVDLGPAPTPLARAQELAAEAWGAGRTWFLPHGATQGNLAACLALRGARGRQVVVQRNVHASVVSGLIAGGLTRTGWRRRSTPSRVWRTPSRRRRSMRRCGRRRARGPDPRRADLSRSDAGHRGARRDRARHGARSWSTRRGAHTSRSIPAARARDRGRGRPRRLQHAQVAREPLGLGDAPPRRRRGAPTAGRHRRPGARAVGSTSPSALALASLDAARARAVTDGERLLDATLRSAAAARAELGELPGVRVLGPELAGAPGVHAFDPLRLTVDLVDTGARRPCGRRRVARARRDRARARDRTAARRRARHRGRSARAGRALRRRAHRDALDPAAVRARPAARAAAGVARAGGVHAARGLDGTAGACAGGCGGRPDRDGDAQPVSARLPAVLPGERLSADVIASLRAVVAAGGVVRGSVDGLATFGVVAGATDGRRRRPEVVGGPRRTGGGWVH